MNQPTTALDTSIVARLWPQTSANAALRAAVLVLAGTALLASLPVATPPPPPIAVADSAPAAPERAGDASRE